MGDTNLDTHAGAHGEDHMPAYRRTIVILSVLTAVEFGISYMMSHGLSQIAGILLLVGFACVKAVLVARFFMHLKFDPKSLAFIIATPVILAMPLVILVGFDVKNGPTW